MTRENKNMRAGLVEIFGEFIEGKLAKRARLDLHDNGEDLTPQFVHALRSRGFIPAPVAEVAVAPGERVPAFLLRDGCAYFGWVFWEKFSASKSRKLFGSDVRNAKGDWEIQISPRSSEAVYANVAMKRDMDIDRPFTL